MTLFAASIYWELPVLLVVVSLVYSATRHDRWDRIAWEALGWGFRIAGFLAMIGVGLYVLSSYVEYRNYLIGAGLVGFLIYYAVSYKMSRPAPAVKA